MANPALVEGRTGTLPDGTRVIVRGGKLTSLDANGTPAMAPVMVDTKVDQEAIQAQRDKAASTLGQAQMAERFTNLNAKNATGPGAGLAVGGFWGLPKVNFADFGAAMDGNSDWQAMKSIAARVGPGLRPPGSGSSSDKDTALYLRGFPEVTNYGDANMDIKKGYQTDANHENAKAAFQQTWFKKTGSLLGADQAFNDWWTKEGAPKYDMTRAGPRPNLAANAPRKTAPPVELHFDAQGNLIQ